MDGKTYKHEGCTACPRFPIRVKTPRWLVFAVCSYWRSTSRTVRTGWLHPTLDRCSRPDTDKPTSPQDGLYGDMKSRRPPKLLRTRYHYHRTLVQCGSGRLGCARDRGCRWSIHPPIEKHSSTDWNRAKPGNSCGRIRRAYRSTNCSLFVGFMANFQAAGFPDVWRQVERVSISISTLPLPGFPREYDGYSAPSPLRLSPKCKSYSACETYSEHPSMEGSTETSSRTKQMGEGGRRSANSVRTSISMWRVCSLG